MSSGVGNGVRDIRRINFISGVNGRRYSVSVALPYANPIDKSLPVLYVLDGNYYFASVVDAVRAHWNGPEIVVVGIGYPDESQAAVALARTYDLTLPASEAILTEQGIEGLFAPKVQDVGGLSDFLTVLKSEVMPHVASVVEVDAQNQAIFGHSLGGLAVLHALFSDPNAFRTFIAASPSIWWNDRAVLAGEAAFSAAVRVGSASPRVLITMGGDEDVEPALPPELNVDSSAVVRAVARHRMVGNARELTVRLQELSGTSFYQVADYLVFPQLGHSLAAWPSIAYAIQFVLAP